MTNSSIPLPLRSSATRGAAGLRIGALTNDGVGISGQSFFESVPIIAGFDAFCDAQRFGGKPAPAAYLNAASELGVHPGEVIFLDDMTYCVDGARAVGMQAVLVDPMERHVAFDEARGLAGIGSPDPAREAVVSVEAAYLSQDLDRIMALFDPDISIHWNGERVALGLDEARRFHIDHLGFGAGERVGFDLRKRSGAPDPRRLRPGLLHRLDHLLDPPNLVVVDAVVQLRGSAW